jgi:hypothetical protein
MLSQDQNSCLPSATRFRKYVGQSGSVESIRRSAGLEFRPLAQIPDLLLVLNSHSATVLGTSCRLVLQAARLLYVSIPRARAASEITLASRRVVHGPRVHACRSERSSRMDVVRSTLSATLSSTSRLSLLRPWVLITISSGLRKRAGSAMPFHRRAVPDRRLDALHAHATHPLGHADEVEPAVAHDSVDGIVVALKLPPRGARRTP